MNRAFRSIVLICFIGSFVSCGGGGGGSDSSVTASLSPTDGAANVAVAAPVTAIFTGAVSAPSDWSTKFTLKKGNSGDNLCMSYSASADGLTITCAHADLEAATSYTSSMSGVSDSSGKAIASASATFTTVGYTPVGGTVTMTGTLSAVSTSISTGRSPTKDPLDVTGYKVLILNNSTAEQKTADVAADGSFTLTAVGGSSYSMSFLDGDSNYVGTLVTGEVTGDTASVAVVTGGDGTTTEFGTITADTDTGAVTSSATLSSDGSQLAYVSGGVIAGGLTGEGAEDYTETVGATACTSGAVDCPDLDHDGVPDILDTDNDNNTYADQIDGLVDKCVPGTTKLYVGNYPTCTGATCAQMNFPTPTEIDADPAQLSMYTINLEFTPGEGSSVSDYDYIEVTAPTYVSQYGYVYNEMSGEDCFNTLWETCNGQRLKNYDSDPNVFKIQLGEPPSVGKGAILANIRIGDTYVFKIVKKDATEYTCTRKIGIIQKYYPYAVTYDGTPVPTSETVVLSWPASTEFAWSLAPVADTSRPKGMTYQVRVYPFTSTGGNCAWDPDAAVVYAEGEDLTSTTMTVSSLQDVATSAINMWGLDLYAIDEVGDETFVGPFSFTTESSKPCN